MAAGVATEAGVIPTIGSSSNLTYPDTRDASINYEMPYRLPIPILSDDDGYDHYLELDSESLESTIPVTDDDIENEVDNELSSGTSLDAWLIPTWYRFARSDQMTNRQMTAIFSYNRFEEWPYLQYLLDK